MKRPPPSTGGIFSLKNTPELPKLEVIARKNNLVVQEHVSPLQGDRLSHRDPVMEQRERLTLRSFEAGQLAAPLPPPPRANDPEAAPPRLMAPDLPARVSVITQTFITSNLCHSLKIRALSHNCPPSSVLRAVWGFLSPLSAPPRWNLTCVVSQGRMHVVPTKQRDGEPWPSTQPFPVSPQPEGSSKAKPCSPVL